MQYRKINGHDVSLLGFGGTRFPRNEAGVLNQAETRALFDYGYRQGINYYDTAYIYYEGLSEKILGDWLVTVARETVYIADKLPIFMVKSPQDIQRIFTEQLQRLQTDYIDFYLLHSLSKENWKITQETGALAILEELKASGKIRNLGFSFHDDYEVFAEILNAYPWDFCQIQFNYIDADYQAGTKGVALAKSLGIPLVVMEPLKGGLLATLPQEEKALLKSECSDAAMALRWVAGFDQVSVILSGMGSLEKLQDNLATLSDFKPLTLEENARLQEVANSLAAKTLVACTACEYCQPCPCEVNIPRCFRYLNFAHQYDNHEISSHNYNAEKDGFASLCSECRACEAICPQHLPVVDWLKQVVAEFGK